MGHLSETLPILSSAGTAAQTVMQAKAMRTAKISEFRAPTPKILFGQRLDEITKLENSIAAHGLMKPLKVSRAGDKLVVIDGRKRLTALRRMRFKNTLPRSLNTIPFVMSTEPVPNIQSAQQQYYEIIRLEKSGLGSAEIIKTLCMTRRQYQTLLKIKLLSPRLTSAFLNNAISLEQAAAFLSLPQHTNQDEILLDVGPFAAPEEILNAAAHKTENASQNCCVTVKTAPNNIIHMRAPVLTHSGRKTTIAA